jgi:hypothetical protein
MEIIFILAFVRPVLYMIWEKEKMERIFLDWTHNRSIKAPEVFEKSKFLSQSRLITSERVYTYGCSTNL